MEFIENTLGGVLDDLSKHNPNGWAVRYTDRNYFRTWKELNDEADLIARGMMSLGVKKGDHVAIWATNTPEWILTLFAAAKIGAVLVTVNTNFKIFELEYLLRQSDTKLLVMIGGFKNNDYVATVNELLPELKTTSGEIESEHLPFLKRVVFAGKETPEGMLNFEDLKILGGDFPVEIYEENKKTLNTHDVVNMQYTSGTTGFPKGVMLTHYNILNNGKTIGDGMKFTKNDKLCITVPFFHCFGLVLAMMACITHGTTMVPVERYSPVPVMNAISVEKCTAVHGVPTMFIAMLEHAQFNNFDFSSLRTGIMAGSPCPIEVMKKGSGQDEHDRHRVRVRADGIVARLHDDDDFRQYRQTSKHGRPRLPRRRVQNHRSGKWRRTSDKHPRRILCKGIQYYERVLQNARSDRASY